MYKVLAADYHSGQGKMGGVTHTRLLNLETGTQREISLRADLKIEEVPLERRPMDYLYAEGEACAFMHPETFEQVEIPRAMLGNQARLLVEGMRVTVEFVNGSPVSVTLPDVLEVRILDTAPATHQQQDSTWKPAKIESGIEVMVPQFIKTGDTIRLDVANLRYMDRAKAAGR
jgi:elongation factor P